ncbi:MAG TPA: protein kinase [Gemmataceae bacterium]|nr:protein kinase [Gemmataceae bacterium]
MNARPDLHPSADTLRAFGLGKLDDLLSETVIAHIDTCPDCRQQVGALTGDSFLDRLRQAHSLGSTPAPAKSLAEVGRDPQKNRDIAAQPSTPIPDLPPELANHPQYEILRELGRGGMGVVYLAKNRLMGRQEVLKVVNQKVLQQSASNDRFLREIQSAAMLSHPNVVTAYSVLPIGDLLVFAMEFIDGEDLAKLVKARGPMPVANACYYVQQAAMGLQHAFEKKMIHRDIKPQNLILCRDGKKQIVKVLDFGLAKVLREEKQDTGLTGTGQALGTPDYMAPEQILDAASADIRADIYSLGCTLYYLLTGSAPFRGKTMYEVFQGHQSMEAKPLNLVRPEVPEELAAVVGKMMAKEPGKRYQTPVEAAQALIPFVKPGTKGAAVKPAHELSMGAGAAKVGTPKTTRREQPKAGPEAKSNERERPPAPEVKEHVESWETLTDAVTTPSRLSKRTTRRAPKRKWPVFVGGAASVLLIGLVALWAAGVFKVKTKNGTIVLENLQPDAEVLVDGEKVTVKWANAQSAEITAQPGTHELAVKKDGFKAKSKQVTLEDGGREVFSAHLEELPKADKPADGFQKRDDDGFVPLFDGKDLSCWDSPELWAGAECKVENGVLTLLALKDAGFRMKSRQQFSDFHLRFELLNTPSHNTSIAIRLSEQAVGNFHNDHYAISFGGLTTAPEEMLTIGSFAKAINAPSDEKLNWHSPSKAVEVKPYE